jgi:hypothetical protein
MASTHTIAALHARVGGVEFIVDAPRRKLPASKRTNRHLPCFIWPAAGAGWAPRKS